jgi:nucleoside-diphosphate-sugar epimerase
MARSAVLVTGAAGFIGGWVSEALCARGFQEVRAGVRSEAGNLRLSRLPVDVVRCDIMEYESLSTAMRGVSVVINCVRDHAISDLTVEGTRRLIACAKANGVDRIIQMSSVAVYGNASGTITEDTQPVGPANRYAAEKRVAEELCRSAAGSDLRIAVVRPSLVYGPFGEEWSGRFIRGIVSGQMRQLGEAGEGQANLIYARDLGQFAAYLATRELPHYTVFNANGAEIPTFNEYFERLSRKLGLEPLACPGRRPSLNSVLRRQTRRGGRWMLKRFDNQLGNLARSSVFLGSALTRTQEALRHDVHDGPSDQYSKRIIYSIDRAKQIGFVPQTSLQEGIDASVLWARSQGLIP